MTVRFFLYVLFATSHSNHIKFSAHLKACYSKLDISGLPQCYPIPEKQKSNPESDSNIKSLSLEDIEAF